MPVQGSTGLEPAVVESSEVLVAIKAQSDIESCKADDDRG